MKLCLASGNAHKAQEFQTLAQASGLPLQIVSAREACGGMPEVVEDACTFIGNARKKALALRERLRSLECGDLSPLSTAGFIPPPPPTPPFLPSPSPRPPDCGPINRPVKSGDESPHSTCWVMADDSGLCVDTLGGEPGVDSAYYAGSQGDSAANLAKLVRVMRDVPAEKRGAHFVCVLFVISPDGAEHVFEGRCHGKLTREPRRALNGFGYDPLFMPDGFAQTFSELGDNVKNTLSHRGRAWAQAAEFFKKQMPL